MQCRVINVMEICLCHFVHVQVVQVHVHICSYGAQIASIVVH